MMIYQEIIKKIKSLGNKKDIAGMARFGIRPKTKIYGVSIYELRKLAKKIKRNHALASRLWVAGIHEARLLAGFIDEPEKVTDRQMEEWVKDFDSWDICDQICSNLFDAHKMAHKKAVSWSKRKEEFIKRAGFVMMACLAVHDKQAKDEKFFKFFPLIKKESTDERNFVKKAVNWALRQIGKRNINLNKKAINLAKEIQKINSKSAKWIANDAFKELTSKAIKKRLFNK